MPHHLDYLHICKIMGQVRPPLKGRHETHLKPCIPSFFSFTVQYSKHIFRCWQLASVATSHIWRSVLVMAWPIDASCTLVLLGSFQATAGSTPRKIDLYIVDICQAHLVSPVLAPCNYESLTWEKRTLSTNVTLRWSSLCPSLLEVVALIGKV